VSFACGNGRGHGLTHRHLEDLDVITEPFEVQVVKRCEVAAQVFRKIRIPSCLKNPDGVS
jgi:hypothetical protein